MMLTSILTIQVKTHLNLLQDKIPWKDIKRIFVFLLNVHCRWTAFLMRNPNWVVFYCREVKKWLGMKWVPLLNKLILTAVANLTTTRYGKQSDIICSCVIDSMLLIVLALSNSVHITMCGSIDDLTPAPPSPLPPPTAYVLKQGQVYISVSLPLSGYYPWKGHLLQVNLMF